MHRTGGGGHLHVVAGAPDVVGLLQREHADALLLRAADRKRHGLAVRDLAPDAARVHHLQRAGATVCPKPDFLRGSYI